MGYYRSGFTDIIGVDIEPQPRYPFTFVQADALCLPFTFDSFDAIHASPPCQRYSNGAKKWGTSAGHPDLIAPTRDALASSGKPWVIENIEAAGSRLRFPIILCGEFFNLGVFRHRLFESPWLTLGPTHRKHQGSIGDGKYHTVTGHAGGSSKRDGWKGGSTADWRVAMGIDWMSGSELAEAIPPAYTEWIGQQLISQITESK